MRFGILVTWQRNDVFTFGSLETSEYIIMTAQMKSKKVLEIKLKKGSNNVLGIKRG